MAKRVATATPETDASARPATPTRTVLDDEALALGTRIRERRRALGLSLVRLASETGLSHPFLSQVERGHARPSVTSLQRIAAALGVDAGWLFAPARDARAPVQVVGPARAEGLDAPPAQSVDGVRAFRADGWPAQVEDIAEVSSDFDDRLRGEGDMICYVVAGSIEVQAAGETLKAGPGEVVFLDGSADRHLRSTGEQAAHVVAFRLLAATPAAAAPPSLES
jgi:transcriptional regulator with XRE-family HTH domain